MVFYTLPSQRSQNTRHYLKFNLVKQEIHGHLNHYTPNRKVNWGYHLPLSYSSSETYGFHTAWILNLVSIDYNLATLQLWIKAKLQVSRSLIESTQVFRRKDGYVAVKSKDNKTFEFNRVPPEKRVRDVSFQFGGQVNSRTFASEWQRTLQFYSSSPSY